MSLTISIQNAIDKYLFSIPCLILKASGKKPQRIKKVLIIKFWALGDSVVLLPAIKMLKKEFPNAEIDVLAHERNKAIFEGHSFINKIIPFGTINILKLFKKYDLCIDAEPFLNVSSVIGFLSAKHRIGFSHGIRNRLYNETIKFNKKQHMVQNYLDFVRKIGGKYNVEKLIPLYIPEEAKKDVLEFLNKNGVQKEDFVVGISIGVAESVKHRIWPVHRFAALADRIIEKYNAKIIFIDSKSSIPLIHRIESIMKHKAISAADEFGSNSKIKQSAELIKRCNVMISNDSGPMHIAAAQGVKTIGLFGPNTPVLWGPYGKGNIALFKPKKGVPYIDNTKRNLIPKILTKEQLKAMEAISVNDVMKALEKMGQ